MYYYGARYYDARSSVFISVDPLADKYSAITPYAYAYAFNNPIAFTDPTGKEGEEAINSGPPGLLDRIVAWFTGDKNYKGSGWGHGLRTAIHKKLGLDDKVSNIVEAGALSMLQRDKVTLEGQVLEEIAKDPDIVSYEAELLAQASADPKFGKEAYSFFGEKDVQLGGDRAPGDMWEQAKDH